MDETARLKALRETSVLDTDAEARFDRIAEMAARHFDVPIALVSLVDSDRQWFKACIGLSDRETPREWAFCHHAIELGPHQIMVVEDATKDARFANNPLVTGAPHIRFYAGATLTTQAGANLGTLCVIDDKPRQLCEVKDLAHLRTLADLIVDQLELSQARAELDDRHRMLDMSEQLSLVGYWTLDTVSGEVFWSKQVYEIHGVDDATFQPGLGDALSFYVEEDREMVRDLIAQGSATGAGWSFDATIQRHDGSRRSVRSIAECHKDAAGKVTGFFGVFKDLTDERRAIAEAVEQERRYRLLADHASDVIAVYDASGRFSYLSPSIVELLGYLPEEMIGRSPFDFMAKEDHERVKAEFARAARMRTPPTVEYRALTKDGRVRWLEARPRYRRGKGGRIVEVTDAVRDVTDRRERENALAEARTAAESATRAKADFLAHMSHEIRTPMAGVIGFTELLGGTALDPEQRRFVDMIGESGQSLMQLLNDILDLSKIDAGQMPLVLEPIDLRHKMRGVIRLLEPAAAAKGVALSLMIDDALPSMIVADQLRLRQIMINLTGNAVKFTQQGQVTISVSSKVLDDVRHVRIQVQDSGIGIAPERLKVIFDRFSQADNSISRTYGGTGLGLAITKQLVDLMSARLQVESTLGVGSTFTVDLPLEQPEKNGEAPILEAAPCRSVSVPSYASTRILVAEDHEVNQMLMQGLGKQLSLTLDIAANGKEALDMVERAEQDARPYDLVLMDMQMPVMDGLEATRQLRARGFSPERLPVVALTANAFAEDVAACLDAGMQQHVGKPISKADLAGLIERFVGRDVAPGGGDPVPDPALVDVSLPEGLKSKYVERRQATLESFTRLSESETIDGNLYEQTIEMLHQLSGTAGMFGEAQLGEVALQVEHALRSACASSQVGAVRDGFARLQAVPIPYAISKLNS